MQATKTTKPLKTPIIHRSHTDHTPSYTGHAPVIHRSYNTIHHHFEILTRNLTFRKLKKVGDSSHRDKKEKEKESKRKQENILTTIKEGETVEIIGDGVINNINARGISKN